MLSKAQRFLNNPKRYINRAWNWSADKASMGLSTFVNVEDCKSVCLTLGPYRNLTTLTAAILFLHPDCQVLNHAGKRIYNRPSVDFLYSDFDPKKLDRFIQYAITISKTGTRGRFGGSIEHSHAFDAKYRLQQIAQNKSSRAGTVKSLFWKESMVTSNRIRDRQLDFDKIFAADSRLRFLLPIRHPIDCAISNLKTRHVRFLRGVNRDSSTAEVVDAILNEIFWFGQLKKRYPDRFHYFFAHEISEDMLVKLASFMDLEPYPEWVASALSVMTLNKGYEVEKELLDFYRSSVMNGSADLPELRHGLLAFIQDQN